MLGSDAEAEIVFVRMYDGTFHAMNGNHRTMGARLDQLEAIEVRVISPEDWRLETGFTFDPSRSVANPQITPGPRPER